MKTVIAYAVAYLYGTLLVTFISGAAVFFLAWLMIGLAAFATWSSSVIWIFWADILAIVRMSFVLGFVISILFILSKEGKRSVDDFVNDWNSK
jgi:uncharacterized protein (DUF983 family)